MEKIPGPALCGFDDVFVGATPPKPPAAKPGKPGSTPSFKPVLGPKPTVRKPTGKEASPHKAALVSTVNAGQAAVKVAKSAETRVKKHAADVKAGKHGPAKGVKLAVTRIKGDGEMILGVVPPKPVPGKPAPKKLTPAQHAAVVKHAKSIAKTTRQIKRLDKTGKLAKTAGDKAKDFVTKAAPWLKQKLEAKTTIKGDGVVLLGDMRTALLGEIDACLGLLGAGGDEQVGMTDERTALYQAMRTGTSDTFTDDVGGDELLGGVDANGLSPGQEGYDQTSDPDYYNAQGAGEDLPVSEGGVDPTTGKVTDINGKVLYDPKKDLNLIKLPVRGLVMPQEERNHVWRDAPPDAINFQGAFGDGSVGSASWFSSGASKIEDGILKGTGKNGFIFTRRGTHYGSNQDNPRFMVQVGDQVDDYDDGKGTSGQSGMPAIASASESKFNSPLIGNPDNPMVSGLQYATKTGTWFWQGQYAAKDRTMEVDAKIAESNAATIDAATKAAMAIAAQTAADKYAADEEANRVAAEQLLAQTVAEAQQQVATTQAATADITAQQAQGAQIAQLDIATAQAQLPLDTQYQQLDMQAQQQRQAAQAGQWQLDQAAQAAEQHALIQQTDVWNTWAQKNPEAAVAQMQQQGISTDEGGGGDEGAPAYAEDEAPAEEPAPADEGEEEALPDNGGDEGGAGVLDELLGSLDRLFGDDGDGPDDVDRRRQEGGG